jgi:tripartite-type tricarboxylate transporter receptor subunit TctC
MSSRVRISIIVRISIAAYISVFAGQALCAERTPVAPPADFPNKPIRFIDANSPGGGTEYLARVIGSHITQRYGQPIVIDNRPGAGGNIGAEIAAKASPDGYNLFLGLMPALAASPSLYSQLSYNVVKDFSYVTTVASGTFVVVVTRSSSAKTVADLVMLSKSIPGQLSYSSAGVGSPLHLVGELLKRRMGIEMVHVPYKGGAPAIAAVTTGEVQVGFGSLAAALPLIKAGRLTALAVTSAKRARGFPELPTIAESGFPDFDVTPSYGVLAPAATSPAIVAFLNAEIGRILKLPDVQARFATQGLEPTGSTPAQFKQLMQAEVDQWAKVIRDANIKM